MPITFQISSPEAMAQGPRRGAGGVLTSEQVIKNVWKPKDVECKAMEIPEYSPLEMLQSSYTSGEEYSPSQNGFVRAVILAYNTHQNLVIRPDDIWIAILSQLNLYINAHAEELRPFFVQHDDQKELEVVARGTRYTVDFGAMAQSMSEKLKENINDPSLHDFIMPNFTTTTANDKVICSVMMMSALKSFFNYTFRTLCGVPSITLLGEKSDYQSLLTRMDTIATFGREPAVVARLLRPILTQFINVFDAPPELDFWSKICHYKGGSGSHYVGGWISAFCVWGAEGKWMGCNIESIEAPLTEEEKQYVVKYESSRKVYLSLPVFVLGGLRYPVISTTDIPDGFCQVDVKLNDNGREFKCMMVAGHVGFVRREDMRSDSESREAPRGTIQSSPEWFLFVIGPEE